MYTSTATSHTSKWPWARLALAAILLTVLFLGSGSAQPAMASTKIDITGPAGSGYFGAITVLPNGNIVVVDQEYDAGSVTNVGAVYLYNGATGALISTLTGSTAEDKIGSGGVTVLSNGNYVIKSPSWNNGPAADAGAATWGNGASGVSGPVSAANSLVGSSSGDVVGYIMSVTALSNGNYIVSNPYWDNEGIVDAGAVTWGDGATGVSGTVSAENSLVGSTVQDQVGSRPVTVLSNDNYVIGIPGWDNGTTADVGAVTWGNGATGVKGTVSAANSLVGSASGDHVGDMVIALSNDDYVVSSVSWNNGPVNDAGAVTWGDGTTGVKGIVTAANSLVGTKPLDYVGINGVTPLSNGNYVVRSAYWDTGTAADAGAVTWGNGATGIQGEVTAANSLVGSTSGDHVGENIALLLNGNYVVQSPAWDNGPAINAGAATWRSGVSALSGIVSEVNSLVGSTSGDQVGYSVAVLKNSNYVVNSPNWDNDTVADAGAATWGDGTMGIEGAVSEANSLVGTTAGDRVGHSGVYVLSNGNYVALSPYWDNGTEADAGAATWGDGTLGIRGAVSAENSLVGSTAGDNVGSLVTALSNGNYVVGSPYWDSETAADAGAATWRNGTMGIHGAVSVSNSLVGSTANDMVGIDVAALSNGNYVVATYNWDNGAEAEVGAATWGNGITGISGTISASNSLIGVKVGDQVGSSSVTALSNGNYVVGSATWHNGEAEYAGAATWGNGLMGVSGMVSAANSLVGSTAYDQVGEYVAPLENGNYVVQSGGWDNNGIGDAGAVTQAAGAACAGILTVGPVTAANSVLGTSENGGNEMRFAYDPVNRQLVVARPADNVVTLFRSDECKLLFLPAVKK